MSIWSTLFGSGGGYEQVPRFEPQQQQALNQLLSSGLSGLQNPYSGFEPISDFSQRVFQQQTVPSIAERFTGMDGQRSSAFKQALGAAGADLSSELGTMKSLYGMENQKNSLQQLMMGLEPRYNMAYSGGSPGIIPQALGAIGGGIGGLIPGAIGSGINMLAEFLSKKQNQDSKYNPYQPPGFIPGQLSQSIPQLTSHFAKGQQLPPQQQQKADQPGKLTQSQITRILAILQGGI